MTDFLISDNFYLNGEPFKILAGAIHYFRIHPSDWYHSLYNLKAMGFNTVETYVPWNLHEYYEGEYNFDGILDIERFLTIAHELGLYAIIRPAPYICAELEFGGLPAWLLDKPLRIRSSDTEFLNYVSKYYDALFRRLVPHQLDHEGNIIMFQIENEYGSYGQDKVYLRAIKDLMFDKGITMPLFTADGHWQAALESGSLIEDNIFVTGNFGSQAKDSFAEMQKFFDKYDKQWPYMVMEFWDGWFTHWGGEVVKRDPDELSREISEVLEYGSICLYMFHGGTTFGFMNGCNAYEDYIDLPQITSYDYGAPLDEAGNPTERYYSIQSLINDLYPDVQQNKPLIKPSMGISDIKLVDKVSLFETIDTLSQGIETRYPLPMERLGQNVGYTLYKTEISKYADIEKVRLVDCYDRAHIFIDGQLIATQYRDNLGDIIEYAPQGDNYNLTILVENLGRVNYGPKLLAPSQNKGINTGVMVDIHFVNDWIQYPLEFCYPFEIENIDFSKNWQPGQPSFYLYEFNVDNPMDTYIDLSDFGKGIALMNGNNLGRYWNVGPVHTLYVPHGMLKEGINQLIIFETENEYNETINLIDKPIITLEAKK